MQTPKSLECIVRLTYF